MADEKQLTVAELLARNAKERSGDKEESAPRRRRRRSLDEGGISVAELTGSLPKVKDTPQQARHSNVDINESAPVVPAPKKTADKEVEKPATKVVDKSVEKHAGQSAEQQAAATAGKAVAKPADDDTTVIKKVEVPAAVEADVDAHAVAAKPTAKVGDKPAQTGDSHTGVIPVVTPEVPAEKDNADVASTSAQDVAVAEDEEAEDEVPEEKLSALSVVFLALAGIVLGAVVFKGFEILWGRFDRMVVTLLAAMVTIAIVGLVHALRTNRDVLSMFLGAIVGLVLTFGPLAIILL